MGWLCPADRCPAIPLRMRPVFPPFPFFQCVYGRCGLIGSQFDIRKQASRSESDQFKGEALSLVLLAAWRSCGVWVSRRTWRRQTRHRAAYRLHGGLDSSPHEFLDSPRPPGAGDNAGNSTPRGRIEKELNSSDEQTRKHWSAEEWFRSLGVKPGPPHPTAAAENTTLACGVCGKPGVSICAQCSAPNKKKYRRAIAQAHPLLSLI